MLTLFQLGGDSLPFLDAVSLSSSGLTLTMNGPSSHLSKKILNAQIKGHLQLLYSGLQEYCLMLKKEEFLRSVIGLWR